LFAIAGWAIFLSVLLHGFSALPLARWYAQRLKTAPKDIPELLDVPDFDLQQEKMSSEPQGATLQNDVSHTSQ
jgi:hypothetical protein